jgi:membrane protein involved in colicin uptake
LNDESNPHQQSPGISGSESSIPGIPGIPEPDSFIDSIMTELETEEARRQQEEARRQQEEARRQQEEAEEAALIQSLAREERIRQQADKVEAERRVHEATVFRMEERRRQQELKKRNAKEAPTKRRKKEYRALATRRVCLHDSDCVPLRF